MSKLAKDVLIVSAYFIIFGVVIFIGFYGRLL